MSESLRLRKRKKARLKEPAFVSGDVEFKKPGYEPGKYPEQEYESSAEIKIPDRIDRRRGELPVSIVFKFTCGGQCRCVAQARALAVRQETS